MSLRHPRIQGRSQGRSGLSRAVALGWGRGWNGFLAAVGGRQRAETRQHLFQLLPLLPTQLIAFLPPYRLLLSGHKQSDSLFFSTWPIYKTASWWVLLQKPGPSLWSSSRSVAERLSLQLSAAQHPTAALHLQACAPHFLSHSHILCHVTMPLCAPTSYPTRELAFVPAQIPQLQTVHKQWQWLFQNWIGVAVCTSAPVSHNMMAASTYRAWGQIMLVCLW